MPAFSRPLTLEEREPYDVPCKHPAIRRVSATVFIIYGRDGRTYFITAAELALVIDTDVRFRKLLKSKDVSAKAALKRSIESISHWVVVDILNKHHAHPIGFVSTNEDGKWFSRGRAATHNDFGIQGQHLGSAIRRDAIENNPIKRAFVQKAMWAEIERLGGHETHGPQASSSSHHAVKRRAPDDHWDGPPSDDDDAPLMRTGPKFKERRRAPNADDVEMEEPEAEAEPETPPPKDDGQDTPPKDATKTKPKPKTAAQLKKEREAARAKEAAGAKDVAGRLVSIINP
ncbi:hypothetical protein DFP72DRAFT_1128734 [Ephemerocybe angulata]|uniref:Uncharacterized protein n=1 Tax=Ephemerocybe angulata TaxID=980116 RepID=A0A8H6HVP0_9AGAR|nr:hypothetical protein DFP72DRAFT_1128734 [Tulosesus angulatus]